MEHIISALGFFAGFLTTVAYIPQGLRILRTRHTKDLSLVTYILLNVGMVLWIVYGALIGNWPLIIPNVIVMFFILPILILKIRLG